MDVRVDNTVSNWKWKWSSVRPSVKSLDSVAARRNRVRPSLADWVPGRRSSSRSRWEGTRCSAHIRTDAARYRKRRSKLAAIVSSGGSTRFMHISYISLGSLNNCPYPFGSGTKIRHFDVFNGRDVIVVRSLQNLAAIYSLTEAVILVKQFSRLLANEIYSR